jgi:hypothetical protein
MSLEQQIKERSFLLGCHCGVMDRDRLPLVTPVTGLAGYKYYQFLKNGTVKFYQFDLGQSSCDDIEVCGSWEGEILKITKTFGGKCLPVGSYEFGFISGGIYYFYQL